MCVCVCAVVSVLDNVYLPVVHVYTECDVILFTAMMCTWATCAMLIIVCACVCVCVCGYGCPYAHMCVHMWVWVYM